MFAELEGGDERRAATGANLRLSPGVAELMNFQKAPEKERATALLAFVRIFAGVVVTVHEEPVRPMKPNSALLAFIRITPAVDKKMLPERGGLRKTLVANLTLVRSLAGVRQAVPEKVGLRVEAFAALLAVERALAGVRQEMIPDVGFFFKHFAASGTFVTAFQAVNETLVPRQLRVFGENFAAHQTAVTGTRRFSDIRGVDDGERHRRLRRRQRRRCGIFGSRRGFGERAGGRGGAVGAAVVEKFGHVDESFAAGTAVEGVGGMRAPVSQEYGFRIERQTAIQAEEMGFAAVTPQVLFQGGGGR